METAQQTIQSLTTRRTYLRVAMIAYVPLCVAAVALLFVSTWAGLALGALAVGFYLFWLRGRLRRYRDDVAVAVTRFGVAAPLTDVAIGASHGADEEKFRSLRMLPLHKGKNTLLVRNGFTGRDGALTLTGAEVTFHYPARIKGRDSYRFLSGTLLTSAHTGNSAGGDWLLLKKDLLDAAAQTAFLAADGWQAVQTPAALAEKYALYAGGAGQVLPDFIARRIAKLCEAHPATAAMRLWETGAALFLHNRFYTGSYPLSVSPAQAHIGENTLPVREDAWALFRSWARAETVHPQAEPAQDNPQNT